MTSTLSIAARCTAQAHFESPLGRMLLARTEAGLAGVWSSAEKANRRVNAPSAPTTRC